MLDGTNIDLTQRVAVLVQRVMAKRAIMQAVGLVGQNDDLRTSGLSSLDIVNLMLSVEAEFDLKIPERDMTPTNFRSIARIADLVGALLQQLAAL